MDKKINRVIKSKVSRAILLTLCFTFFMLLESHAQKVAIKTNVLYGAYTSTPNLGLEFSVAKQGTIDLGVGFNPWDWKGSFNNNKKLVHWLAQAEYRHWLCRKFSGHFIGVHALGTQYNIGGHKLPLLFGKNSQNYRFEGWGVGAGISYGYNFFLGKRWGLETSLGLGYARLHYDKYDCVKCGKLLGPKKSNYFGPTKASISLIYIIK